MQFVASGSGLGNCDAPLSSNVPDWDTIGEGETQITIIIMIRIRSERKQQQVTKSTNNLISTLVHNTRICILQGKGCLTIYI